MRVLFLLVLLLTSCHHGNWEHTSIPSGNQKYDIAKLTHRSSNPTNGMELELTRHGKELHGYVNVKSFEFPFSKEDSHTTLLTISTHQAKKTFVVPLLEGGQRARLTDTCLKYLVQTLQLKKEVTLSSGPFIETLNSESFERHYDALLRESSRIKPQNLIHFELF